MNQSQERTNSLRVLILENSPDDAQLILLRLEQSGIEVEWQRVETESDFRAALADEPDLILADYSLPSYSGIKALELRNELGLDIPFILVSGTVGEDTAVNAMKIGAADYIMKDRLSRLGEAVLQAMEKKRLQNAKKEAEIQIRRQLERLNALREIDIAIASTFDLSVSLSTLLSQTIKHLQVDAAAILLMDFGTNTLDYAAGRGFRAVAGQSLAIPLGGSFSGKAAREQRLIHIPDLNREPESHLLPKYLRDESVQSYSCFPLIVKGKVIGVMETFDRKAMERDNDWLDFFITLAGQAAVAVDNAQLFLISRQELAERRRSEEQLRELNAELEQRVLLRTADLNRANLELAQSVRVKDEFLATMSHELRTPLNSIIGLSESLLEGTAGEMNEKQQLYASTIAESGRHLLELINDILDLAKIDAGQITLNRDWAEVRALCQSSLRLVKQMAHQKEQELSLEVDEQVDTIYIDERRLKQMIVNLLSNAVKFTPAHGKIDLKVQGDREKNMVSFIVQDTGIGISEDDLQKIFRPFVQLDSKLARTSTGTGLGLALVAKMARLHGGSVSVESQVDAGSRFAIHLPWQSALVTDSSSRIRINPKLPANVRQHEDRKHTILLVEDTETTILVLRDFLEFEGYHVEIARNGADAILLAAQLQPNLILMDVQMPELDGLETTRRLRSNPDFMQTPIIALTALAMPGDRERCLAAGMDDYMTKPISLKELSNLLARILEGNK